MKSACVGACACAPCRSSPCAPRCSHSCAPAAAGGAAPRRLSPAATPHHRHQVARKWAAVPPPPPSPRLLLLSAGKSRWRMRAAAPWGRPHACACAPRRSLTAVRASLHARTHAPLLPQPRSIRCGCTHDIPMHVFGRRCARCSEIPRLRRRAGRVNAQSYSTHTCTAPRTFASSVAKLPNNSLGSGWRTSAGLSLAARRPGLRPSPSGNSAWCSSAAPVPSASPASVRPRLRALCVAAA